MFLIKATFMIAPQGSNKEPLLKNLKKKMVDIDNMNPQEIRK